MLKAVFAFAAVLFMAGLAYADTRCENCKMNVRDDSPYKVTVKLGGGAEKVVCSIYCASVEAERAAGEGVTLVVVDYLTGEELDARKAVWVEGSDAKRMMSDVSRVAFKDTAAAEAFVKERGGRIATFDEIYAGSVNEWKGR